MKKAVFKISALFIFLPFIFFSCASTPSDEKDITEPQIEFPLENDDSQAAAQTGDDTSESESLENQQEDNSDYDTDETATGQNEAEPDETEPDADGAAEDDDMTEYNGSATEDGVAEDDDAATDADTLPSENTDEETATENEAQDYDDLQELEEPEVITLEYDEQGDIPAEEEPQEEPITSETLDLDYVDVIDDDEDDEIRGDITEEETAPEAFPDDEAFAEETDSEESLENQPDEEIIEASRKVTLKMQEYVEITYPGNGWVYMGLTDGSKDLSYFGRKLGTKDTKFTLQAKASGTKYAHFYRTDPLTGEYIDDYVEIEVLNEKGSNKTRVQAPEYKAPVPKKAKALITNNDKKQADELSAALPQNANAAGSTASQISTSAPASQEPAAAQQNQNAQAASASSYSSPAPENPAAAASSASAPGTLNGSPASTEDKNDAEITNIDEKALLQEAQLLYNNKEYSSADKKIKEFLEYATANKDAGLFLQGQILEAKSEIQDIKAAVEAYSTLTRNYPASSYWEDANKRIIYLSRFYLEVR